MPPSAEKSTAGGARGAWIMRTVVVAVAAVALWGHQPASGVREVIAAGHGAPAVLCSLAANSVGNGGWGWADAPVTPLPRTELDELRHRGGEALSAGDLAFLLDSLSSTDACVRQLDVLLLVREGEDAQVAPGLIERLGSPDSSLRSVAAFGLGMVGSETAVDPLISAARAADVGTRANAVWALGRIEDGRALRPLTAALGDRSPLVRQAAAEGLGHLDSTTAVAALLPVLARDPVARVRRTAAWALGNLEADEAVAGLSSALQHDGDAGVREMCAWALGNIDEARGVVPALLSAAQNDKDEAVRETAVWAVGQHEDPSAAEPLGRILASDQSVRVKRSAAWALGQLDLKSAPSGLTAALKSDDADLRVRAAWALSQIEDGSTIPALEAALDHEQNADARKAEMRALIHSGANADQLSELLKSKDAGVREAAIRGLAHGNIDPWPWPEPRPRPFP